ncbi:hypothetical protein ES708_27735 [subsurface metagenome]
MAENENIIVQIIEAGLIQIRIGEPTPIQIKLAEPTPISANIVMECVPSEIGNIFIPGVEGHRITKLYFKNGKFQGEYETD